MPKTCEQYACVVQAADQEQYYWTLPDEYNKASAPIPFPKPNPKPHSQPLFQSIAEFFHDYFFLLLLLLMALEVFVLPKFGLSLVARSTIVFFLCSGLLCLAQGPVSMLVYWLAMVLILVVFYGDILMELAVLRQQGAFDDDAT